MANSNISVRVNGRPASNGGHIPLVSINSPQFQLEDKEYVGFNDNSYFFTVKIVENYVIYKLVKNNIRSHNAIRPSTFHIAFSIPKGFQLANEVTPYDVLKTLLDVFLNKCLECKDTVRGTYEFKDGLVDQHVLDEVVSSFSIIPCETPWRIMNTKSSIGYYLGDDQTIKQILSDIQYPEFQKFSEIVFANAANGSTYVPIDNLEEPRKIAYSLYIDNQFEGVVTDEVAPISINSQEDPICYINKTLTFTLEEALAGKVSEYVNINKAAETIRVSTQGLAVERVTTIQIVVVPNDYQQYFVEKIPFLLTSKNDVIKIDRNLCFTLRGIENSQDFKNSIRPELTCNEYVLKVFTLYGDEMRLTIEPKPQIKPKELTPTKPKSKAGQHKYPATIPASEDNIKLHVVDLAIRLSNCEQIPELVKVSLRNVNKRNIIASTSARFNRTNKTGEKEAHFYIDKNLLNNASYILFKLNNTTYKANIGKDVIRNGIGNYILLTDEDFEKEKITLFKLYKKLIILAAILISAIILTICATLVINHHSDIQNPNPEPLYPEPSIDVNDDQIEHTLDSINNKLNTKDLSFDDVTKIYNQYAQDSTNFNRVDNKKLEGKTIGRIKDYYSVVIAISNGDVTTIESSLNKGNELHIYDKHRNCLYLICKAYFPKDKWTDYSSTQKEEAEIYFRNHCSQFKSFDDLKEIEDAITPSNTSTNHQNETEDAKPSKKKGKHTNPTTSTGSNNLDQEANTSR